MNDELDRLIEERNREQAMNDELDRLIEERDRSLEEWESADPCCDDEMSGAADAYFNAVSAIENACHRQRMTALTTAAMRG